MPQGLCAGPPWGNHRLWGGSTPAGTAGARANIRRLFMQWQTPTATDLRFGFEITMYVAAR
jgi:coenzyme PQQ precursor peptide PqqA